MTFSNVNVQFLPPNTTSVLQPCDQGIITNFKLYYRHLLINRYIQDIEDFNEVFRGYSSKHASIKI